MNRDLIYKNFTPNELNDIEKLFSNEERYKKIFHIRYASALGFRKAFQLSEYNYDTVDTRGPKENGNATIYAPNSLNYFANRSFVAYLIETYGYEKMLYFSVQDFTKITFEEYFGKSYKELEADWKQYLIDNIENGEWLVYGDKGKH